MDKKYFIGVARSLFRLRSITATASYALFVFWLMVPSMSYAETTSRDLNIDAKMSAGPMAGMTPPTGSQTAASATAPASDLTTRSFVDPYLPALRQPKPIVGQADSQARVYEVKGKAFLIKQGSPVENQIKKELIVAIGDTIRTEKGASVSITFDESYANAIRIPEDSTAVLESIEPTHIRIENGTIFSAVDGLPQGSTWKISTPSAVAAVRGTLYLVTYQALNGQFFAATVDIPDDGKDSAIDIKEVSGEAEANVPEGQQITLAEGQEPDATLVKKLDPSVLDEILKFFRELMDLRERETGLAPPTGGQGIGDGDIDDFSDVNLDQSDTGIIEEEQTPPDAPITSLSEESEGESEGEGEGEGEGPGNEFPELT